MNGNLSQIVVQLLIGFLPAAVLLFSMRLNYLKQSYSYRDDGFSSVGAALTESAKLKLVVTAGFLFFQSLVLIIYAPPSFIFVFVLAIIMINVAAMVCMATNYQMADHLIDALREQLDALRSLSTEELLIKREKRLRSFGRFRDGS